VNEPTRAYIYRVLTACVPLAVAYGHLNEQEAALWLAVAAAVLGTGLAALNTSTKGCDGCADAPHGANPERWD